MVRRCAMCYEIVQARNGKGTCDDASEHRVLGRNPGFGPLEWPGVVSGVHAYAATPAGAHLRDASESIYRKRTGGGHLLHRGAASRMLRPPARDRSTHALYEDLLFYERDAVQYVGYAQIVQRSDSISSFFDIGEGFGAAG